MTQLAEKRHEQILEMITRDGSVVISAIARELNVSDMTIRRDLKQMEDRGLLIRVHGGAIPAGVRYDQRLGANAAGKAKAARKLETAVPATGLLYLDGSTTLLNLIGRLKNRVGLQVVTNNVETFQRLSAQPGLDALLLGGQLDRRTDNLIGPLALRSIRGMTFRAAFFSARGLSDVGPTEVTLEDAEVKDLIAERAEEVYLAVDQTKLGVAAAGNWHPDPARTTLVTDLNPDEPPLEPYRNAFREVW